MKKFFYITVALFIIGLFAGCSFKQDINSLTTEGNLLFRNSIGDSEQKTQSLMILDLESMQYHSLSLNGFNARFAGSNKLILLELFDSVCFYDVDTQILTPIYFKESSLCPISYVNESKITVVENANLFLVDLSLNKKILLADDVGNPEHDSDGKFIYYSINPQNKVHKICRFNIETGAKEILFNGIRPRISKDGKKIAYYTFETGNKLIVKNLETGLSWTYDNNVIDYCFSSDGEKLAIVEYWHGIGYYDGNSICIWDYETDQRSVVLPKYPNGECLDIDWIQ